MLNEHAKKCPKTEQTIFKENLKKFANIENSRTFAETENKTPMAKIDLAAIMEAYKLDKTELGKALFPKNAHPYNAIDRLLKGEGALSLEQALILSRLTGVSIEDLTEVSGWKASLKGRIHYFSKDGATALFNLDTGFLIVTDSEGRKQETYIISDVTTLKSLIETVEGLLNN